MAKDGHVEEGHAKGGHAEGERAGDRHAEERHRDGERPAWIRTVGPEDAEGDLAGAYRRIGAGDRADHVIRVHSLHPAGMEGHVDLYRSVMFGRSPLSRRQREAVAVVVSAANDCFY